MCTLFLFWESQCGGELGQLLYMYVHICDSHQILNQKPNWYGMGMYSHSLWAWCKALGSLVHSPSSTWLSFTLVSHKMCGG